MNKQSVFLKNTAILFVAMFVSKIVGAVLKIPLANILGGMGMGYFSTAYSFFSPVYAFIAAGLPIVITKLTARNMAVGKGGTVRKIGTTSLLIAVAAGFAGMVVMLLLAVPFSDIIANSRESYYAVLAIAPSVLLCCIAAVLKGYYEGLSNMYPTAVSQVIEAVVKAILGLSLSQLIIAGGVSSGIPTEKILPLAAAGAVLGVTAGEFTATAFLLIRYCCSKKKPLLAYNEHIPRRKTLAKKMLAEAFPISVGAVVANLVGFVDLVTMSSMINRTAVENSSFFSACYPEYILNGDFGTFVYGSYCGIVTSLFTLGASMTALIGKSALPGIAASWQQEKKEGFVRQIRILFTGIFIVGFPVGFAMGTFAEPVLNILYPSKTGEIAVSVASLQTLGFAGIGISFCAGIFAVFQAIDRSDVPIKLMMLGAVVKLAGNYILLQIPQLAVSGAAVSTALSYITVAVLGERILCRLAGEKIGVARLALLPFCAALLSAVVGAAVYIYPCAGLSVILRLAAGAGAGAAVYAGVIFAGNKNAVHKALKT